MEQRRTFSQAWEEANKKKTPYRRWRTKVGLWCLLLGIFCHWMAYVALPVTTGLMFRGSTTATITQAELAGRDATVRLFNECFIRYEFTVDRVTYEGPAPFYLRFPHACPELGSSIDIRYSTTFPSSNIWALSYNFTANSVISCIIFAITVFLLTRHIRRRLTPGSLPKVDQNPPQPLAVEVY